MGSFTLIKNSSTEIDLREDYRDNGWSISENKANHSGCNQGLIKLNTPSYKVGEENIFSYIVSNYKSGVVYIKVGNHTGTINNSNGIKHDLITPQEGDVVSFFSDGNLTVELVTISVDNSDKNGTTLWFDEKENKYVGEASYEPDMMLKFINEFFSFKNGALWKHNVNETRNNFYGVQYHSEIIFYVNIDPGEMKWYSDLQIKSNLAWFIPEKGDIKIYPTYGKSKGMLSRLKKNRFRHMNGSWFADFLRNMADPRFTDEVQAMWNGEELYGDVMEIRIVNDSTTEVRLKSVSVRVAKKNYTY